MNLWHWGEIENATCIETCSGHVEHTYYYTWEFHPLADFPESHFVYLSNAPRDTSCTLQNHGPSVLLGQACKRDYQ
jgi:hypothetical protein